jgi:hypothetical protein
MKLRYPTEKDLMAALRERNSRRSVTAAGAKARRGTATKRAAGPIFPICYPRFL